MKRWGLCDCRAGEGGCRVEDEGEGWLSDWHRRKVQFCVEGASHSLGDGEVDRTCERELASATATAELRSDCL